MAETVVVVDDDEAVREALVETLAADGYAVLSTGEGDEAWRALGVAPRPCVVLVDLVMPRVDGAELARTIASRDATDVRVICITAGRGAMPEGCHAILRKPFDESALLAAVRGAFAQLIGEEQR